MKDYIVSRDHKQLVGISTSLCRTKINNAKKAKIEQILTEMKNNIQPLTGLEDNEMNDLSEDLPNHTTVNNSTSLTAVNYGGPPDRKVLDGKLKELNLNSSSNKPVNNTTSLKENQTNKNSLTNHSLIPYSEHSDELILDEVSDESQSSTKHRLNSHQSTTNQLPNKTTQPTKSTQLIKRNLDQQDENVNEDIQSDDSVRKRKKSEPIVNSTANHNNVNDHSTNSRKRDPVEESKDDSSSDSDSSSGSSESSSSDDNLSDSDSVSSSIRNKDYTKSNSKSRSDQPNDSTNKNSNTSNKDATVNSQQQPPPRSWALSSLFNNNNNNLSLNDKLTNLKSPPATKAQLKQPVIPNEDHDKVKNVIDSVVKGNGEQTNAATNKPTTNKRIDDYYSDDSSSSSSSRKLSKSSTIYNRNSKSKQNSSVTNSRTTDNKRQKRSLSRIKEERLSDLDQPPNKASKKSNSSTVQKIAKEKSNGKYGSDKEDKYTKNYSPAALTTSNRDSSKIKQSPSSVGRSKENKNSTKSINKELPKNLLVSIDLSTLEKKKSSKKENDKLKSSSGKDVAKENLNKKETDYKDKYRNSDKKSSKESSKESSKDKYKNDRSEKYDKSDKTDKYDKPDKYDKQEKDKKSKKFKEDEKAKENKKRSTKEDEAISKHKKSKKESSRKEDRLKESIKSELFDKPVKSNETASSTSSSKISKESTAKSAGTASQFDKDNNNKDTASTSSKDSSTFKEPSSVTQKSSNHHAKDELDYQKEGTKWKHTGDRETDPIKQYCKYLEAAIYFLQFARQFERTNDAHEKTRSLYTTTLAYLRSTLQNKFIKFRPATCDVNRLSVLGLRLLSLTIFHMNKFTLKEMRLNEKHIRTNLSAATNSETADPTKPDQPLIVKNKMHLSINLYTIMKKQLDYLNLYNDLTEMWQQADHIIETDANCKSFFKKLNAECGQLSLNSNIDDLVPYVRTGLKQLNIDYS